MKIRKFLSTLLLCGTVSVAFVACSNDDDDDNDKPAGNGTSIMKTISNENELDSFVVAVNQIGLNSTLKNSSNLTVFAPSNQSFIDLLSDNNAQSISSLPNSVLDDILKYHISDQGKYKTSDLSGTTYLKSIDNSGPESSNLSIQIVNKGGNLEINGDVSVTKADLVGSNGVVHIIDEMLEKPNMFDFIKSDTRFDSMMVVLKKGLAYENQFKEGKRTIFLPTNQACASYISNKSSYNQMSDIDLFTIPAFVGYHLVNGNILSNQMIQGQTLKTKQTNNLIIDLSDNIRLETTNGAQGKVKVIDTDIQSTSGVIHVVEEVLLY